MPCPDYQRIASELESEHQLRVFETARADRAETENARLKDELSSIGKRIAAIIAPRELRALHAHLSLGAPYRAVSRDVETRAARLRDMEEGATPPPDPEDTETIMARIRQLIGEPT